MYGNKQYMQDPSSPAGIFITVTWSPLIGLVTGWCCPALCSTNKRQKAWGIGLLSRCALTCAPQQGVGDAWDSHLTVQTIWGATRFPLWTPLLVNCLLVTDRHCGLFGPYQGANRDELGDALFAPKCKPRSKEVDSGCWCSTPATRKQCKRSK